MILKFCKEIPKDYLQVLATVIQGTYIDAIKRNSKTTNKHSCEKEFINIFACFESGIFFPFSLIAVITIV